MTALPTHVPAGEIRNKRTAAKLKGTKPGWPDFILTPPTGQLHCLELKRRGGVPHAVCRTLDEALAALDAWHFLTIKIPPRGNGGAP